MSGDVFGNGMLLSRQIRLLAAFDHRHIFVDPDPDPETTFVERERMFALGRSSWEDYDQSLLSPGGFIVPRGSKEVQLTPEARVALGIPDEVETVDGESLIRHILLAPAELLWNGGIGTYVKASRETNGEVGDASNDPVRVDADQLRVQVVGEGGNLGFTQVARIQYAMAGGRINTDALDNSGGVDMSDREVNLKVLLGEAQRVGRLEQEARNRLLEELTEAEVALVLEDNESQSLAVSLDEIRVGDRLDDFMDLMAGLERANLLDRGAEDLPDAETLQDRVQADGKTLVRPELCVLLAYAKLQLKAEVLRSDLPDDPATEGYHRNYFPPRAVHEAGEEALVGHRLRREIIATQLTNDLVDLMGATFVYRVARDTGKPQAEVARAWVIASRLAGHREIIERLREARGRSPAPVVYRWVLGLARVLERTTRWVLANVGEDEATETSIREYREGLDTLRRRFPDLVTGDDALLFENLVRELTEANADPEVARSLITLRFLDQLLEILGVARSADADAEDAARAYYSVSHCFHTGWLRGALLSAAGDDRWEQRAAQGMHDEVARAHQRLTVATLNRYEGSATDLERYQALLEQVREDEAPSLSALWAVVRELSTLGR
jgi:glutamate dehydrogenase